MSTTCDSPVDQYQKMFPIGTVGDLLNWDWQVMMPDGATPVQTEQKSLISSVRHELLTDDQIGRRYPTDELTERATGEQPLIRLCVICYRRADTISGFQTVQPRYFDEVLKILTRDRMRLLDPVAKCLSSVQRFADHLGEVLGDRLGRPPFGIDRTPFQLGVGDDSDPLTGRPHRTARNAGCSVAAEESDQWSHFRRVGRRRRLVVAGEMRILSATAGGQQRIHANVVCVKLLGRSAAEPEHTCFCRGVVDLLASAQC